VDERIRRVSELLHEAGEVHHVVYRITDGADDDWASFYADWLTQHSELGDVLGAVPVRSHLVHELVESERAYEHGAPAERWEDVYAARLLERFGAPQAG
jgi:NTP pyrophosphatase (non-canonical NTP hydrolase)